MLHATIISLALLFSDFAFAHGDFKTYGDLQSGLLHPFLDYVAIMHLLLSGIFLSDHGREKPGVAYLSFGIALFFISFVLKSEPSASQLTILYSTLIFVGVAVIVQRSIPTWFFICVSALLGVSAFFPFAGDAAPLSKLFVVGMILIYFSVFSWLILLSRSLYRFVGFGIAKRVLGSWIVAASVLLLVFSLKYGSQVTK